MRICCFILMNAFQVKYSSESLMDFLRQQPEQQPRICNVVIDIFCKNLLNERISYPLLNFLNIVIGSGVINDIVLDASSTFSSEVFRLTRLEIKGHKKLYKLVSSINVFCQLIQVIRSYVKRSQSFLNPPRLYLLIDFMKPHRFRHFAQKS